MELLSSYAPVGDVAPPEIIGLGEGPVGQCALENKRIRWTRFEPGSPKRGDSCGARIDQFRQPLVSLNDEATLNILDAAFAKEQTAIFAADLALSWPISHAQWQARPWREKLSERLASMIGGQL